jgi:hypothetical protein
VPTTSSGFVAKSWHCEGTQAVPGLGSTTVTTAQDCAITAWATLPPFPPFAPVNVPTPVVTVPTPMFAGTVSASVTADVHVCASPPPSDTTTVGTCAVEATVNTAQMYPLLFGLSILVTLAVAAFVYRHGRPWRFLVRGRR